MDRLTINVSWKENLLQPRIIYNVLIGVQCTLLATKQYVFLNISITDRRKPHIKSMASYKI